MALLLLVPVPRFQVPSLFCLHDTISLINGTASFAMGTAKKRYGSPGIEGKSDYVDVIVSGITIFRGHFMFATVYIQDGGRK